MMKKYFRTIVSILISSMIMSCGASTHFGVFTVAEPSKTDQDVEKWFLFYQDQFDATNGKVSKPSDGYPLEATEGYLKAEKEWNQKVYNNSKYDTIGAIAVIGLVIYLLLDPSATRGGDVNPGTGSWR